MQVKGLSDVTVSNVRKLACSTGKLNSCYQNFRSKVGLRPKGRRDPVQSRDSGRGSRVFAFGSASERAKKLGGCRVAEGWLRSSGNSFRLLPFFFDQVRSQLFRRCLTDRLTGN